MEFLTLSGKHGMYFEICVVCQSKVEYTYLLIIFLFKVSVIDLATMTQHTLVNYYNLQIDHKIDSINGNP